MDEEGRDALRFMMKLFLFAMLAVLLLELTGCENRRSVVITAGSSTRVEATTSKNGIESPADVSVTVIQPQMTIPVLVPMPMPYERVTAEKPEAK